MADKKISELTELTTPDGTEELVVNDSGVSKKITQANLLSLADGVKATFGNSDDLQIYHDGGNSVIQDNGVGDLYIMGESSIRLTNNNAVNHYAKFNNGGSVQLYHNNLQKLATTSTGIDVTGRITTDGITENTSGNVGIGTSSPSGASGKTLALNGASGQTRIALKNNFTGDSAGDGFQILLNAGSAVATFEQREDSDISFNTDNAERMRITSTGNVGIGTTSPDNGMLNILKESDYSSHTGHGIHIGSNQNNAYTSMYLGTDDTIDTAYIQSANKNTGFTKSLAINPNGGNVGIGTSSPTGSLHIKGSNKAFRIESTSGGNMQFGQWDGATNRIEGSGNKPFQIISYSAQPMTFATNATERMRIDSSGKVGIGTTSPARVLDVNSGVASDIARFGNNSGSMTFGYAGTQASIDLAASSSFRIRQGSAIPLTVSADGNVGIGTSSPLYTLTVREQDDTVWTMASLSSGYAFGIKTFGGSTVGSIQHNGSSTSFNTSSDYRLKENVVPMTGSIDRLKELKPSRFNFIADADTTVDGFLAHEAGEVVPEAVAGEKDAMTTEEYEVTPEVKETITIPAVEAVEATYDDDGNILTETVEAQEERTEERVVTEAVMGEREVEDYQGIDQSKLVPLLVASLQEAIARIEVLEAEVKAIKDKYPKE